MSGSRIRIECGIGPTLYLAPEQSPELFTEDRFAARKFRSRWTAELWVEKLNQAIPLIRPETIPTPAFTEDFD